MGAFVTKLRMFVYLRAEFDIASIILTSFRQGVIPHHHLKTNI